MTSLWRVLEDAAGSGEEETPEDKGPVMAGRPCWVGFFPRSSSSVKCSVQNPDGPLRYLTHRTKENK